MTREQKKKEVQHLIELIEKYPTIGIINFKNLPNTQFQRIRRELRNKAKIKVSKKNLIDLAFKKSKDKDLEELSNYLKGEVGLILSKMDPFKLSILLKELRANISPKSTWKSDKNISISKGSTPFLPGPMVGELQSLGLPARIKSGRVIIQKDTVFIQSGEEVGEERAQILKQLDITPMEVGLDLLGAYDGENTYGKDLLTIDIEATKKDLIKAHNRTFNLAYNSEFPIKENIKLFLNEVNTEAFNLGINAEVYEPKIINILLQKAYNQVISLKSKVK